MVASSVSARTSWLHRKISDQPATPAGGTPRPHTRVKRMANFSRMAGRLALFAEGRPSRTGKIESCSTARDS